MSFIAIGAAGAAALGAGTLGSAAVGAGAGLAAKGIGSAVKKGRQKKQLAQLQQESPMRRAFMEDISSMRKSYQQGTAYQPQINQLKSQQATTNEGIIRATGGSVGAAVTGLTRAGKLTQDATADLVASGDKTMASLLGTEGAYIDSQAKKGEDLALMQYGQQGGESAELAKTAEAGVNEAVASGGLGKILAEVKRKKAANVEDINVEDINVEEIDLGTTAPDELYR